ncbi:Uncharacterized protein PFLU_2276 [Pseudomonas [fluorescens] SBW25]|uniref:Uncharacterized protein n=1 Tax=Pseudomonas fluorescens (strain SBW25) TaxID=216595 RepID=C3K548_PSEFS|nr:Uncharacterized protein PFLU_2276 [Pseudomonas fluorescens SBW25]
MFLLECSTGLTPAVVTNLLRFARRHTLSYDYAVVYVLSVVLKHLVTNMRNEYWVILVSCYFELSLKARGFGGFSEICGAEWLAFQMLYDDL